jgi:hypothetical protein
MDTMENELGEVLEKLRQAGMEALVCDTPVPVSNLAVKCGQPTMLGDRLGDGENILIPKALVGMYPEIFVTATGDSMTGVNYDEGDRLRVQLGVSIRDGDNVLAWIDGCCTVKTYFQDDEGLQWLVPQNDNYDAILLTGEYDVQILGRVVGVEKASPRVSFRECQKYVRRARQKQKKLRQLAPCQVDSVIVEVGAQVKHARQWYAVYRALLDSQQADEGSLTPFCEHVAQLLPDHGHLPTARELQRMAVQSFAKPVALWNPTNAPVSGVRFTDYLRIAHLTAELLEAQHDKLPF